MTTEKVHQGYEDGGPGPLLDALLYAADQATTLRSLAIQKKASWAAYYMWKRRRDYLRKKFLERGWSANDSK